MIKKEPAAPKRVRREPLLHEGKEEKVQWKTRPVKIKRETKEEEEVKRASEWKWIQPQNETKPLPNTNHSSSTIKKTRGHVTDEEERKSRETRRIRGTAIQIVPALLRQEPLVKWTCRDSSCRHVIGPLRYSSAEVGPRECKQCGGTTYTYTFMESIRTSPLLVVDLGDMEPVNVFVADASRWSLDGSVEITVSLVMPRLHQGAIIWQYGWPVAEPHLVAEPYHSSLSSSSSTLVPKDDLEQMWESRTQEEAEEERALAKSMAIRAAMIKNKRTSHKRLLFEPIRLH